MLGILGGVLFSATMASFALLAKKFGDGTFTHQDPRTIVWVPLALVALFVLRGLGDLDRKSTRLNSSHLGISYAVFCLKKKNRNRSTQPRPAINHPLPPH